METANLFQYGSSWPVKFYFCLLHILLLSLVFYIFLKSRKKDEKTIRRRGTRTFTKNNRAVTSETCEWLNSTLAWFYLHSDAKKTPDLVKLWIRNLNRELYKSREKNQRIFITNIRPGCLPPKLTSVYCLCVDGTMQCITFHIESTELGFHVHVNQPTTNGTSKNVILEVHVVKLVGEVALQLNNTASLLEAKIMFIGEPEIIFSTRPITKDGIDADAVDAVEEKLKEVICKTVTSVPLAESPTTSEPGSSGIKDKLESPILQTCLGEEGKLLVKVIKASGLCSKKENGTISPYCIIWADHPYQHKRTSLVKDTKSPFWNEYFAFEITSKTREISLNIFDFEKTSPDVNYHMDENELSLEQDDFLGQAIVPLATISRNQTCRLILPILPKTNKCSYVKGELSLEFTFDKDGKVINGVFPLVDATEDKPKTTEAIPVDDTPSGSIHKSYGPAYSYSLDKSYMETSLDELAQEIEAYEAESRAPVEEEKSVELLMELKSDITQTEPEPKREPEPEPEPKTEPEPALVAEVVTPVEEAVVESPKEGEDVEDSKPEDAKEEDQKVETPEPEQKVKTKKSFAAKFKRRPKSTADVEKKPEEEVNTTRHSYHAGDKVEAEEQEKKEEEEEHKEEEKTESADIEPSEFDAEPKSKIRRSFNMKFKRKKDEKEKDKDAVETDAPKAEEPTDESKEQEAVEESLKSDPPKSRFAKFKRSKDTKSESKEEEVDSKEVKNDLETVDENAESGSPPEKAAESKPKLRKLNQKKGKQRPVSMSAADTKPGTNEEENQLDRNDHVRHSYHAGDLPPPPPLRKSSSETSLLSYSPNPYSSLVIEVTENKEKRYYHVPVAMAKRGTYEQKGVKYHVYNDHMFRATHFDSATDCAVCAKTIFGRFGKQGYQCKDCKLAVHKKCHFQTSDMCSNSRIKNIEIKDFLDHKG